MTLAIPSRRLWLPDWARAPLLFAKHPMRGATGKPLKIPYAGDTIKPAFAADGNECNCCGTTCGGCPFPDSLTGTISGITDLGLTCFGVATDCSAFNATFPIPLSTLDLTGTVCSAHYIGSATVVIAAGCPEADVAGSLLVEYDSATNLHTYSASLTCGCWQGGEFDDVGVSGCPTFEHTFALDEDVCGSVCGGPGTGHISG